MFDPHAELFARVRSWHKVPALRMDLRFVRSKTQGLFRVCDPITLKFVELGELECLVVQTSDGQRSIDELLAFAKNYNPAITRAQIEHLFVQLLDVGLLELETSQSGGKVIPLPLPQGTPGADEFQAFRNEIVLDLQRSNVLEWAENTAPVPRVPLFEPARRTSQAMRAQPEPKPDHDDDSPDFDGNTNLRVGDDVLHLDADTNLVKGSDPFQVLVENRDRMVVAGEVEDRGSTETDATPAAAPSVEADGAEPEQEEAPPTHTTPRQAENEQEHLFAQIKEKRKRWYQRTSLRFLFIVAVLVGVASVIDHPLRITAECSIIPSQRAYVRSPIGGVLTEILVDEGSPVKKGDVIAKLDDRQLVADRRKAVAEIDRIEADLQRLRRGARKEEISQQRAVVAAKASAVKFADKERKRRLAMAKEGVGSKQAADEAEGDYQVKSNAYAEASAALRLLQSGTRPEEIDAFQANLKRAKAELEFIEQKLADMIVIRAPVDGVVLTPKFRERLHENVEPGGLVCEIADMRTVRAEIMVPEREIDSIQLGMPVVVKVESYPRHPFLGKVDFIAPAVEVKDKVNFVRVVAVLENTDGILRRDMTGYGEIEAGEHTLLELATRRLLRWIRVRFLI